MEPKMVCDWKKLRGADSTRQALRKNTLPVFYLGNEAFILMRYDGKFPTFFSPIEGGIAYSHTETITPGWIMFHAVH
jgi:hypothetical protein